MGVNVWPWLIAKIYPIKEKVYQLDSLVLYFRLMTHKQHFLAIFFTLFFCSTSLQAQVDHWEKLVDENDQWKYRLGNSEPSYNWMSPSFNDATWQSASGGLGYGDGDDQTTVANCASLYMRRSFTVSQKQDIEALIFHGDYDDGFVAYLNGYEIARGNVDTLLPPYNYSPVQWREAKMYQGGDAVTYVLEKDVWNNALQNGTNVLAIHTVNTNGASSSDLTARYWLHCGMKTPTQVHANPVSWFNYETFESDIAVLRINTWEENIVDDPSIRGEMEIVWNDSSSSHPSYGSEYNLKTNIEIEKRGRWSQYVYPKNGYAIETKDLQWEDTDVSPLELPEEEDWILHGPYGDRSFMRNVLAMHMANKQGNYASRTRFVELFINGNYEGIYVLMEKIKRGSDRVDIAKLNPDEIAGDDLTGGYVFKTDWEPVDWRSSFSMLSDTTKIPYTYTYPKRKNIVYQQEQYIQDYVDDWEHSLQNTSAPYNGKYWHEYMDLNSFVDFFLMMEVTKDVDAYRASTYYHKKKDSNGGKIHAGPIWDFNFAFGLVDYCEGYLPTGYMFSGNWCSGTNPAWWEDLVYTPQFADAVNCRWEELRATVWHKDSIKDFIAANRILLSNAASRNHARWPLMGQNPTAVKYVAATFNGDVALMENWLMYRIDWLDANMIGNDCNLNVDQPLPVSDLRIYPNPNTGLFYISGTNGLTGKFVVRNMMGQSVYRGEISERDEGKVSIDLSHVKSGVYFIDHFSDSKHHIKKVLIQH